MSRLTITLEDNLHQALKETAARQGRTIGNIIEESLRLRGIRSLKSAQKILNKARDNAKSNANLDDVEAMAFAINETNLSRNKK